jgi:NADH-quinone oxidoreductase subunit J
MLALLFILFAGMAVGCAISMVAQRNPLYGAISLIGVFISLACLYVTLAAPFIAAVQVIVYAGAIMVLFLFVIMLLNLSHMHEEPTRPIQQFLGFTSTAGFAIALVYYLSKYAVFKILPPGRFMSDAKLIGATLFQSYIFPFEMVSILLLAAIVGALLLSGRSAAQRVKLGAEANS